MELRRYTKDLTGQRFGRLVPVEYLGVPAGRKRGRWLCVCECGKSKDVMGKSLRTGQVRSCGCLNDDVRKSLLIERTGHRYGRLTAIRRVGRDWKCHCDCGREVVVRRTHIAQQRTCGRGCKFFNRRWKAGPERPRTSFCWECSRQLHGRVFARIVGGDGAEHDVHKACVGGRDIVMQSTTVRA